MISTGICRWLFLLISLSTWTKLIDSKEMRIVCYYTNWSVYRPGQAKFSPQNINPYLCTHLVYAFGGFTKENTLKPFDKYQDIEKGGYAKFTGLKTYNKDLKTLIAIGGWNEGSTRFSSMVASSERRKELVKNTIKFLRQNHFDGLDLDWEYPTFRDGGKPRDRDNYAQLVKELREEFERESEKTGRPRLLLTMAVPAGIEYINRGYDVPKLTKYLDWMNILSYDYHSAFEPAVNHHAPLYSLEEDNEYNYDGELNIDYTIKHYLKMGADPNKLVLGIPTYGRSYTLFNPDAYELGSPADGPGDMGDATRENGYLAYYEICENVKNQDWEVDEPFPKAMGPIAFKDNQWVGYDDENIVRKKAEYVAENSLGGIMFWAIDNDDFRGNCHGKPYPLIEAGKEALINAYGLTEDNLISPPAKPTKLTKKQRPRTSRTTTTERSEEIVEETTTRRRRIKPKIRNDNQLSSPVKKRRIESGRKAEETSTYSSLKIVTPAYTTPEPPATPDMGGAFKCEDEGFFPHPKDCKKYFWCLGGPGDTGIVAHQFTCPAGLHFNKAADSCDYSQNVFCNKKSKPAATTTKTSASSSTEATSSAKPTINSIFSTSRAPPKITAATSKTTVNFRTTTTTEAYEDEEYADEEDEEPSKREESEEDPQVIKELIDLIRKAGGIEELEKQLKFSKDISPSTSSSDATTPSAISKSLYERVLSKTSKNTLSALKKTSTSSRNSGGRQGTGEEASREKQSDTRGRPQYKTLTRQRASTEEPTEQDTDSEDTDSKTRGSYRPTSSLEYVNIRRPKASTTTEANDESGFSRNKILGEFDNESDDEIPEDVTRRNNIPQYVNIRRQRPSTTEPSTSSTKYSAVRRSTLSPVDPESEVDPEDKKYNIIRRGSTTEATTTSQEPTNLRYQTLRRGSTTTPTSPTEAETTETSRRRSTTTQASTTNSSTESRYSILRRTTTSSSIDQEDTTAKYQTVSRETTTPSTPATSSTIKSTTELEEVATEEPTTELDAIGTTLPQEASSNIKTVTTENVTPSSTHKSTTESKNNSTSSSLTTTTGSPVESETKKKRPSLFQPRPFSIGSTTEKSTTETTTTPASKVSQSSFKFRVRSTTTSSPDTVSTINTTIRPRARGRFSNTNRNLNEDKDQQEKIQRTAESKPARTRKRVITTTEFPVDFNEEVDRKYRPAELADLSSLTAADLNLRGGEFSSRSRRRRPTTIKPTSSSTEKRLEESEKTGPNTLTLARKSLDATVFGKNRRLNTTGDDQNNASTNQAATKKFGRGFRTTTPKATVQNSTTISTTEETPLSSSARPRKIIRRFRPGSSPTSTEKPSSEPIPVTSTTATPRLVRKRIPLFRQRPNKITSTTAAAAIDDSTTTTESPLVQLFKTRSRFEVAKNDTKKTDEDIEEEELSNEHTDVLNGEEGENIKLSESNIRESSQINAFAFSDKPKKRRFGKSKEGAFVKPEDEEKTTTTTTAATTTKVLEADDDSNNTRIEPTRIIRTRKIIRKLSTSSTTQATTTKNAANAEGNKKRRILLVGRSPASNSDQIKARPNNPRFRGRTTITTESSTKPASTTAAPPISSTEPEAVPTPKETIEKRRTLRPNFAKRTTEEPADDNAKSEEPPTPSTTTESFASTKFPRLSLYTRPPFSTTEADHDDEEFNFEADNDDEEGFADDSDDDEDEDDYMPKYTIFTTSSIERMHKFESNTNFNDEDEEGVDVPPKTNKSVSSLVYTKALNSRKESEKILNKNTGEEEQIRKEEEARNKLLEDEKERAALIRERVALGREEIASQSQKDLSKSRVGYRSETTAYAAPVTDSPDSTTRSDVENELNYSTVAQETTENLDSTTIKINLSTDAETDKSVLSTTEKLRETTLNVIANSDVENEATEAPNTSSTDDTTTASVEETTNPIISNITETTTEFRRRSTLRSIKDRPKLGLGKRVSKRPSASSTTTEPTLSSSTRRGFSRSFTRGRSQRTTAALDASTKPVTRASRSTSPLPLNKLLYRYSTTARNRFDADLDDEDDEEEEEEDEYDDDEEDGEEHENSLNSRPLFSPSSTTSPRVVNRPTDARKTQKVLTKPKFSKGSLTSSTTEKSILEDLGVDTEAVKNRNKNLFSKRKMNTPIPYSSTTPLVELSSLETTTTTPNTSGTDSTDPNLTTLHHIFAEIEGDVDTTTEMMNPSSVTNAGKLERLIEVNRIVEVKTKQGKVKNHAGQIEEDTRVESLPTLDKIGEISRITLIKIVDGNSETVVKDPESNEIGTSLESRTQFTPVYSPPLEVAKVEEIPSSAVLQNVNLKNFQFDIKMDVGDAEASERQERTFQIFGESKVANSKEINAESAGKPEIIDGISHINVVTPKPLLVTEASTISLQGLFQTEKPHLNPSFTTNDEVLETGRSEFVNVRVLDQDLAVNLEKGQRSMAHFIPVRVLPQDNEESTVKAHVMEIIPRPGSRTIKIVPIQVEMSRRLDTFRLPTKESGINT